MEQEVLSEIKEKCPIHAKNIFQNQKCRQCKVIREVFESKKNAKLEELTTSMA